MIERNYKCIIPTTTCVLVGIADSPFILVMLLSEPRCRRVMTTLVRPSTVCLPLNDRNVECVCKEGQINFFHSVLYVSVLSLSYLENHCNLSSSWNGRFGCYFFPSFHHYLNLNPHFSYIGRVSLWHLSLMCGCVSFLDLFCVCVSIISFVCDYWLGWSCA